MGVGLGPNDRPRVVTARGVVIAAAVAATLLFAGHGGSAATPPSLYVSAQGSDGAPCTQARPCLSFDRAYRIAAAGQVVEVAGGTYGTQTIHPDPSKASASATRDLSSSHGRDGERDRRSHRERVQRDLRRNGSWNGFRVQIVVGEHWLPRDNVRARQHWGILDRVCVRHLHYRRTGWPLAVRLGLSDQCGRRHDQPDEHPHRRCLLPRRPAGHP